MEGRASLAIRRIHIRTSLQMTPHIIDVAGFSSIVKRCIEERTSGTSWKKGQYSDC
jgi:hypothetical protein